MCKDAVLLVKFHVDSRNAAMSLYQIMNDTVLRRKELSRSAKLKVVYATVMPVPVYGCETWSLTKKQQSEVQATQMNVLRRIKGVNRFDRVRSVEIREMLNQEGV